MWTPKPAMAATLRLNAGSRNREKYLRAPLRRDPPISLASGLDFLEAYYGRDPKDPAGGSTP
jgi:hypothetical protein